MRFMPVFAVRPLDGKATHRGRGRRIPDVALVVSQPEQSSLSGRILGDLPEDQQPIAHGRVPDHRELAFFPIGKAEVGTGSAAKYKHIITSVHEAVRVDDIVRERGHVSVPCRAVRFPAGQRRLIENLQPVI